MQDLPSMMLWLYLLILPLMSFCVKTGENVTLDKIWAPIIRENKTCPRFILVDIGIDGMGDQIERLIMGLALAVKHKGFSVVLTERLGKSIHDVSDSYYEVYHDILSLPIFPLMSEIIKRYPRKKIKRRLLTQEKYLSYLRGELDMAAIEPCYSLLDVDIYDVCGIWCPFVMGWEVQKVVKPLLRDAFAARGKAYCADYLGRSRNNALVMQHAQASFDASKALNVVWHVRHPSLSTDESRIVCYSCTAGYFSKISNFIAENSGRKSVFHTVVTNSNQSQLKYEQERYQALLGNNARVLIGGLKESICTALSADILITTGSTFFSSLKLFTPRYRPLLIEEQRHNRMIQDPKIKFKWFTAPGDAWHMVNGTMLPLVSSRGEHLELRSILGERLEA